MTSDASSGGEWSAKVLDFERIVKETVTKAKEPGFTPDGWAPLAELVHWKDGFRRMIEARHPELLR